MKRISNKVLRLLTSGVLEEGVSFEAKLLGLVDNGAHIYRRKRASAIPLVTELQADQTEEVYIRPSTKLRAFWNLITSQINYIHFKGNWIGSIFDDDKDTDTTYLKIEPLFKEDVYNRDMHTDDSGFLDRSFVTDIESGIYSSINPNLYGIKREFIPVDFHWSRLSSEPLRFGSTVRVFKTIKEFSVINVIICDLLGPSLNLIYSFSPTALVAALGEWLFLKFKKTTKDKASVFIPKNTCLYAGAEVASYYPPTNYIKKPFETLPVSADLHVSKIAWEYNLSNYLSRQRRTVFKFLNKMFRRSSIYYALYNNSTVGNEKIIQNDAVYNDIIDIISVKVKNNQDNINYDLILPDLQSMNMNYFDLIAINRILGCISVFPAGRFSALKCLNPRN